MPVYQTTPEVMQKSLDMTHALLNIGLGYVPIPVLSPEHYEELLALHEANLVELQKRADEAPPEDPPEDTIEDATVVSTQLDSKDSFEHGLPIPKKRKRKPLKSQSKNKEQRDVSE